MTTETIHERYKQVKTDNPDAIILMRCGDFYETYDDDAVTCSKELGITLTERIADGLLMAGFPHFTLDTYLPRLIRAGHRIAIID